jgi:hypothetical protein
MRTKYIPPAKESLMNSKKRFVRAALFSTFGLGLFLLAVAAPCRAQATASPNGEYLLGTDAAGSTAVASAAAAGAASAADAASGDPSSATDVAAATASATASAAQVGLPPNDDGWHFSVSPYLWFPGMHGTVGARGHDLSVHVSAADLLSHFRFGLMGTVEARRKRIVLPLDIVWAKLGDNQAVPFPDLEVNSANMKATMFILTPKVGYRLLNSEKFKVDALAGFRFWYFGEHLGFSPSQGLNFSGSQAWVDPIVGGRIIAALSPKVSALITGDVGGWGTGSQLEYQIGGVLGYKIKPAWTLQGGFRYMDVDYLQNHGFKIINMAMSGIVFGVTWELK